MKQPLASYVAIDVTWAPSGHSCRALLYKPRGVRPQLSNQMEEDDSVYGIHELSTCENPKIE